MIWLKRIVPLVLIGLMVGGYYYYDRYTTRRQAAMTQHRAELTARVWFNATRFRNEPQMFATIRDSFIADAGLTREQMQAYLDKYSHEPERYKDFARWVNYYIDSLCDVREGYMKGRDKPDTTSSLSSTSKRRTIDP